MKNFLKMFIILIMGACLLWVGYFMVLNNLNYLLATGKTNFQCQVGNPGLIIKTGKWIEVIDFRMPWRLVKQTGGWARKNCKAIIKEFGMPRLMSWQRYFQKIASGIFDYKRME